MIAPMGGRRRGCRRSGQRVLLPVRKAVRPEAVQPRNRAAQRYGHAVHAVRAGAAGAVPALVRAEAGGGGGGAARGAPQVGGGRVGDGGMYRQAGGPYWLRLLFLIHICSSYIYLYVVCRPKAWPSVGICPPHAMHITAKCFRLLPVPAKLGQLPSGQAPVCRSLVALPLGMADSMGGGQPCLDSP